MTKCPTCGFVNEAGARICANCGYEFTLILEQPLDHGSLFQSEIDPIKEKLIEKYQILRFIGKGGFSTVFLLKDKALDRLCALKILAREQTVNPESVERFKREARLYASLDHPHIVAVYDFGIHNHVAYIIFKYIDGITLREHIKRRHPLGQAEIISIASDLADILGYMHQHGVVHRDLKPDNVMIQSLDRKVILTDFGLAKKLDTSTVTSDGKILGSPHYFSPEQAKGEPVDARSDIYSLGITIYEMVTGIVPFKGDTPYEVILKHIHEPLPDPARLRPDMRPELLRLIRRCTEKDPNRRIQEALELKAALMRIPPDAVPEMKTEVIRHGIRRREGRRWRIGPAIAATAAIVAVLAGTYLFVNRGTPRTASPLKPDWNMVRTPPQATGAMADERFASLLREANALLAKGDLAGAREKAAAARKLKAGKEADELDGQIQAKFEAATKKPAEPAGEQKKEAPAEAAKKGQNTSSRIKETAPSLAPQKEVVLQKPNTGPPKGNQGETSSKPEAMAVPPAVVESAKPIEAAKIMDLPDALRQNYIKELGSISTRALAGEFKVSGTMALAFAIDEAGYVSLKSMNDGSVKIDPVSRRAEILELIKSRVNGIKVQPPVNKAGSAVRIENWRVTFRVTRDRQVLFLVRIS